ncbi:hypothetical protein FRB96_009583 [Tulasnella sp. 330]|nr:hypothetical protein FRB96_009583 [Tulasnella sp. 330]
MTCVVIREPDTPSDALLSIPSVGSVDPKEWRNFLHGYTFKVTRLLVDATLDAHAISFLRQLLEMYGGTLCPNAKFVHVLVLTCIDATVPSYFSLLFSTSLSEVMVGDFFSADEIGSACREVTRAAPNITKFALSRVLVGGLPHYTQFNLFPALKIVDLCGVTWEGWKALGGSCSTTLVEIRIACRGEGEEEYRWERQDLQLVPSGEDFPQEGSFQFPLLTKLTFKNSYICRPALLQSTMPSLRRLYIDELWDENGDFLKVLGDRSPDLQDLKVGFNCGEVTSRTLDAISRMQSLKQLRLDGRSGRILFDDAAVDVLACRLPHLRLLSIQVESQIYSPLTTVSLLSILRHCIAIESLALSLDVTGYGATYLKPEEAVPPGVSLKHLKISCGPLPRDIRLTAQTLATWCPNVIQLEIVEDAGWSMIEHDGDVEDGENEGARVFSDVAAAELVEVFHMIKHE